jgi:hypothetical protein
MNDQDGYYVETAPPFGPLDGYNSAKAPSDDLDHGFEPEEPPHDRREARRAKGWTTRTILFATLLLAVLNAHAIQTWATTLPPDWGGQTVRVLADAWCGRTSAAGLDRPRAAIHDAYDAKKSLTWDDLKAPAHTD